MIIGITGALGAGKGTVAEYLTKKHNLLYLSVRNFYAEEVLKKEQAATRENITTMARELRASHGPTYVIQELLNRAGKGGRGIVIESIRTEAEAEFLKARGGVIWCVTAELENRYRRFTGKAMPADAMTLEQFTESDTKDMDVSDPNTQNLPAVCAEAVATLNNNGSRDELFSQVEEALKKVPSRVG